MSKLQNNGYSTDETNKRKRMETAKASGSDTDDYSTDYAARKKKRDGIEGKQIFIRSKKIMRTPIKTKVSPQIIPDKIVNKDKLDKMLEILNQQEEVKALKQENAILKKAFQDIRNENKEMKNELGNLQKK
ncbi:hypothetical protein FQA39_LY08875 [Lamprigera yunnana]|nr:hypothetical protein FQA39_LY08875 [Lamprigera yunnana]